jgi:hypothetical protein
MFAGSLFAGSIFIGSPFTGSLFIGSLFNSIDSVRCFDDDRMSNVSMEAVDAGQRFKIYVKRVLGAIYAWESTWTRSRRQTVWLGGRDASWR